LNFFFEKAEFDASVKPRATSHPSQPVIQKGKAITVDPMFPAIGALLPFTTKPMPLSLCSFALRAIHVLLLLVHWSNCRKKFTTKTLASQKVISFASAEFTLGAFCVFVVIM